MKRLLYAIAAMTISSVSIAGGGDFHYGGFSKNKKYGFDLQSFEDLPDYLNRDASSRLIPVDVFPYLTGPVSGDIQPPAPISGCAVVLSDRRPAALFCGANASSPAFHQVIYAFIGKGYLEKGSKFKCVYRCSAEIPQQFDLWESGSGED